MVGLEHVYETALRWTGNTGAGTTSYRAYERSYDVSTPTAPTIAGSADAAFRGDPSRWNPENLLVASLSACHLLSFLHRAAVSGVNVVSYTDDASGVLSQTRDGGALTEVVLRPRVTVETAEMAAKCEQLHVEAHAACFIASSVNFPVRHEPTTDIANTS